MEECQFTSICVAPPLSLTGDHHGIFNSSRSSSSSSLSLTSLQNQLYFVERESGTFGIVNINSYEEGDDGTNLPEMRTHRTVESFTCSTTQMSKQLITVSVINSTVLHHPTRVVCSGDLSLQSCFQSPPPDALFPAIGGEAESERTRDFHDYYSRMVERARPMPFILDEGKGGRHGAIYAYKESEGLKPIAIALRRPRGMTGISGERSEGRAKCGRAKCGRAITSLRRKFLVRYLLAISCATLCAIMPRLFGILWH